MHGRPRVYALRSKNQEKRLCSPIRSLQANKDKGNRRATDLLTFSFRDDKRRARLLVTITRGLSFDGRRRRKSERLGLDAVVCGGTTILEDREVGIERPIAEAEGCWVLR